MSLILPLMNFPLLHPLRFIPLPAFHTDVFFFFRPVNDCHQRPVHSLHLPDLVSSLPLPFSCLAVCRLLELFPFFSPNMEELH